MSAKPNQVWTRQYWSEKKGFKSTQRVDVSYLRGWRDVDQRTHEIASFDGGVSIDVWWMRQEVLEDLQFPQRRKGGLRGRGGRGRADRT